MYQRRREPVRESPSEGPSCAKESDTIGYSNWKPESQFLNSGGGAESRNLPIEGWDGSFDEQSWRGEGEIRNEAVF